LELCHPQAALEAATRNWTLPKFPFFCVLPRIGGNAASWRLASHTAYK